MSITESLWIYIRTRFRNTFTMGWWSHESQESPGRKPVRIVNPIQWMDISYILDFHLLQFHWVYHRITMDLLSDTAPWSPESPPESITGEDTSQRDNRG